MNFGFGLDWISIWIEFELNLEVGLDWKLIYLKVKCRCNQASMEDAIESNANVNATQTE